MRLSLFPGQQRRGVLWIWALTLALPFLLAPQEKITLEQPAPAPAGPDSPFTIERLETRARFEDDGASRREIHTVIRIHSEGGARQFSRLNFDYHRSFEQIEIPLLRILHANGGSTEILPSAISDQPNPAVADAPAYHDVRRKSARILGLQSGDTLEYRVITGVSHHPLAPDFYLTHSFSRAAGVLAESLEVDLPASRHVRMRTSQALPAPRTEKLGEGASARVIYRWERPPTKTGAPSSELTSTQPDLVLTTFESWGQLAAQLSKLLQFPTEIPPEIKAKADELTRNEATREAKLRAVYEFVSRNIRPVHLPPGATGFKTRSPREILSSRYATPEDKQVLFSSLSGGISGPTIAALVPKVRVEETTDLPYPSVFGHMLTASCGPETPCWMDLSLEVAPYRMISSEFRGRQALLAVADAANLWHTVPLELPFDASQRVSVDASLTGNGKLTARVKYALRGDNELLLRIAFHRAPREQWKNLAQVLSLSDGFRGEVSNVIASDPWATREPFAVEYDLTQSDFVNWSKPAARLPIPLPVLGLPDAVMKTASNPQPIDLGSALEVETQVTLGLPPRTTARAPVPTAVRRDYAEFISTYAARPGAVTASRRLRFLLREIPAARAADYAAFVRAVENDEAQEFTLERAALKRAPSRPAASRKPN